MLTDKASDLKRNERDGEAVSPPFCFEHGNSNSRGVMQ